MNNALVTIHYLNNDSQNLYSSNQGYQNCKAVVPTFALKTALSDNSVFHNSTHRAETQPPAFAFEIALPIVILHLHLYLQLHLHLPLKLTLALCIFQIQLEGFPLDSPQAWRDLRAHRAADFSATGEVGAGRGLRRHEAEAEVGAHCGGTAGRGAPASLRGEVPGRGGAAGLWIDGVQLHHDFAL